jgi:hypothetical protein
MRILNRNTFVDEEVTFKKVKKGDNNNTIYTSQGTLEDFTLVYIGKSCYTLQDLKKIVSIIEIKDLNDSLNYRVKNYNKT